MFPLSDANPSRKFPLFNIIIIVITSLVFFLQLSSADQEVFIFQYALVPAQVDLADFATLIPFVTAIFLHGGFLHIISNMWFLWIFGDNIEGHFGWLTFVILYFASGIIGNVAQYILMPDSPIPMLGASGAVAGILGAY
ncbi:rhomboid family intramembrane serine protease, partial [Candidatus Microgenomates bacterium]|nr:rhomboid family intramembrane serine protease [Candidatus Microgenomates bacterium]